MEYQLSFCLERRSLLSFARTHRGLQPSGNLAQLPLKSLPVAPAANPRPYEIAASFRKPNASY
jgi:hypothetical protein